ncbi:hypothetical protein pETSU_121 [Edwardsiella phage pEt-SU]|uniref:Uncharacterized protein n=1 Tax=Edwardsiella phage pEt-SU TaxID=2562142 RepID=A0A4D6DWN1_9CAUD|nr:hypothetical protein HOV39_gp121 [Edwardsiella phage pEt-SU]QBZ70702.1 hypothetical protein pETSU_121 [Edwardsiella phage pEt-SU]
MAIRNEYTLPNGTKLRVAGNDLKDIGVVLSAIGDRLQDLLERRLTGMDYVHQIDFGNQFLDTPNVVQCKEAHHFESVKKHFRNSSPVSKVQITLCTLFGGRREGILEVHEVDGARTWVRFSPHVETMSKLAVFFQRAGRKAQYGKNCHCQVCQAIVLDVFHKPHHICEECAYTVIN